MSRVLHHFILSYCVRNEVTTKTILSVLYAYQYSGYYKLGGIDGVVQCYPQFNVSVVKIIFRK